MYDNIMDDRMRELIETGVMKSLVKTLLSAGFFVTVNNGGDEDELQDSNDEAEILRAMRLTDEDHLLVSKTKGKRDHFVYLVYGNDGLDLICDYSFGIEDIIKPTLDLAEKLEECFSILSKI